MSILSALSSKKETKKVSSSLKDFLENFSIEVMPRTASKIEILMKYCLKIPEST